MRTAFFLLWPLAAALIVQPSSMSQAATANVALGGTAYSTGPLWAPGNWDIRQLLDGDRGTVFHGDAFEEPGFAYLVDLGSPYEITEVRLYPRQDGCCPERLSDFRVSLHEDDGAGQIGAEIWGEDFFTDGTNPGSAAGAVVVVTPPSARTARWVRLVSLADPVPEYALQVTEMEVFAAVAPEEVNRALGVRARANQALFGNADPAVLVNGDTASYVHGTEAPEPGFAYEINLGTSVALNRIVIIPRQDGCCPERLSNYRVSVHSDNEGEIGEPVWRADLFTDGSNPGSEPGARDTVTGALDPSGEFEGQWIRIESLEDPVSPYALQIAEVQAYGIPDPATRLLLTRDPQNVRVGSGGTATFSAAAIVINGDPAAMGYQWQQNGVDISGATNSSYTTGAITTAAATNKFRVVVSYPGADSVTSQEAGVVIDYALGAQAFSNRPLYVGWPISWLVDGDLGQVFHGDVEIAPGFAYEVNLRARVRMDSLEIYPRQDVCCPERLTNFRVSVHEDNGGVIGDSVWEADLFTDGSNPGSGPGTVIVLTNAMDPGGVFEGQWIRILSLDDPVQDYALQMNELVVLGTLVDTEAKVVIHNEPIDAGGAPGRVATFSIDAGVVNGDPNLLTYQWKKNGVDISGATSSTYVTPLLVSADEGAIFSVVVSYPGAATVESAQAKVVFDFNYARGGAAYSNRPIYANWPIEWLVDGDRGTIVHGDADIAPGFAYEIDMGDVVTIEKIDIYPRQDNCCPERLTSLRVSIHEDDVGAIGGEVWSADLFVDGSNPGVGPGTVFTLTDALDPAGEFKGQWLRILSLEDPVQDYALQISEVEVIGRIQERPLLILSRSAGSITLTWNNGALEAADSVAGPWTSVPAANSPFAVQPTGAVKFYRLRSE